MVAATVRKVGTQFHLVLSEEESARLGIDDGESVEIQLVRRHKGGGMRPKVREAFEASWERNEAGYRYLVGR